VRGRRPSSGHQAPGDPGDTPRDRPEARGARPPSSRSDDGGGQKKLSRACGTDLSRTRDRALFLVGFAGALRRSELVALDVEHITWTRAGMKLLIGRSKSDAEGEGAEIAIPRGQSPETCPMTALQQWLTAAEISAGALFRKMNRGGAVEAARLVPDAVRQILLKRAAKAGLKGTLAEPVSPHGLRAVYRTRFSGHKSVVMRRPSSTRYSRRCVRRWDCASHSSRSATPRCSERRKCVRHDARRR